LVLTRANSSAVLQRDSNTAQTDCRAILKHLEPINNYMNELNGVTKNLS